MTQFYLQVFFMSFLYPIHFFEMGILVDNPTCIWPYQKSNQIDRQNKNLFSNRCCQWENNRDVDNMLSKKFKPISEGSLMLTSPRPPLNSLSRCKFLDLGQKIILSSVFVCHCHMLGRPAFIKHKDLVVSRWFFGDVLGGPK